MTTTHTDATPAQVQAFLDAVTRVPACTLAAYQAILVGGFVVGGEFVAYSSPDSTYLVTKQFLEQARQTILIGMYDFNADYIKQLLLDARGRGVAVTILWDLDAAADPSSATIFATLQAAGCTCVLAPSCRGRAQAHFFPVSHQKVVVVDGEWVLVQSGNYSPASIPENQDEAAGAATYVPGQRDMGVAVHSPDLAAFFTRLIQSDLAREEQAEQAAANREMPPAAPLLLQAAPTHIPRHFPHRQFTPAQAIAVQPVLSPDNYMAVIPDFVAQATRVLYLEQQYIRGDQPRVAQLCAAIQQARARNAHLDVRIILASPFTDSAHDRQTLQRDLNTLRNTYDLHLGPHVRLLPHTYFTHCHNKLIIVDRQAVLISSQNWSNPGVSQNREAGLVIHYPDLADYYAQIFEFDWSISLHALPAAPRLLTPGVAALAAGAPGPAAQRPVLLSPGDYAEV